MLFGQRLQLAGINFVRASAVHIPGGLVVQEIVCLTQADVDAADAWAIREGFPVKARVATTEELVDFDRWSEG